MTTTIVASFASNEDIGDVNIDGETGLVVTPGSAKDLRYAMDQLYHRPEMARLMGQRARQRYERLFTGSLMGERYMRIYNELIGQSSTETPVSARAST